MKNRWITSVDDIGQVIHAARKTYGVRQDDLAGSAGVSHVYLRDLENGKATVQMGRALKVLEELGLRVMVEMPDDVHARLAAVQEKAAALQATGSGPRKAEKGTAQSPRSAKVHRQ